MDMFNSIRRTALCGFQSSCRISRSALLAGVTRKQTRPEQEKWAGVVASPRRVPSREELGVAPEFYSSDYSTATFNTCAARH